MDDLTIRETISSAGTPDVLRSLVDEAPELDDLPLEEQVKFYKAALAQRVVEDARRRVDLAKLDYRTLRETWLADKRKHSERTAANYAPALDHLEAWCRPKGYSLLDLSASKVDAWIRSIDKAPRSVNLYVSAVSSFLSWLERETDGKVRNWVRGTKARPKLKSVRRLEVPSRDEVQTIADGLEEPLRTAVVVLSGLGLRVGALPSLSINGDRYAAHSKGKDISGPIAEDLRRAILKAGLSLRAPFAGVDERVLADAIRYQVRKLHRAGRIDAAYSVHDFRHFYAVRLYRETHDIYRVSRALNHAGVGVTQTYLRSMGFDA